MLQNLTIHEHVEIQGKESNYNNKIAIQKRSNIYVLLTSIEYL